MVRGLLVSLAILLLLFLLGVSWIRYDLTAPYYGAQMAEVFVEIPRGSTTDSISALLVDAGVLRSRIPFRIYSRSSGLGRHLQAGEYRFASPATPIQIIQRLSQGDVFFHAVTIPEGLTAQETVDHISRSDLGNQQELERALLRVEWIHDLAPDARTLEGYLFPDTYRFPRRITSEQIIHAMVDQFRARMAKLTAGRPLPPGWPMSRLVTLASMIEKEAGTDEERLKVASVFYNRLEKGMPLACDPTIIYALKLARRYDGNLHKSDLQLDSPYNTYERPGLPPGPIANPGSASLRAALNPPKTDFLFFVSRNDGTHQFSKTYAAHQSAVSQFQKNRAR